MMCIIQPVNISGIDLNLLLAFEALVDERHVGRAAKRVGLSQPAFSNAISRLRARLEDPLFVRTAQGMVPTPGQSGLPVRYDRPWLSFGKPLKLPRLLIHRPPRNSSASA
jgi:hypothetical protein